MSDTTSKKDSLKRAMTIDQLLAKKFELMEFEGAWRASFGNPERTGSWIIWGQSGNGKTRFTLQLAKYLTKFGKVAYNTLEEGARFSLQKAVKETGMTTVKKHIQVLSEPMEDLVQRIARHKSPHVWIIDSFQYTFMGAKDYMKLVNQFPDKLFIFISHAEGKQPEGRTAKKVRYHSDVKIRVEGYKAFPTSRFGGGEPYVIWEEGAAKYYEEELTSKR